VQREKAAPFLVAASHSGGKGIRNPPRFGGEGKGPRKKGRKKEIASQKRKTPPDDDIHGGEQKRTRTCGKCRLYQHGNRVGEKNGSLWHRV